MNGLEKVGRLIGRRPGGCEDCHAESVLRDAGRGVYVLTIRHDNTCPTLARIEDRTA